MSQLINDFQKQELKFDINKLRSACDQVLKIKGFDTSLGIPHFAAIPLNQIPNDPDSVKGHKARGVYWTKPDSSGKEFSRDVTIEESEYSEFINDYKNTNFEEIYAELKKRYNRVKQSLGLELRILGFSFYSYPTALTYEYHIPLNESITNKGRQYLKLLFEF